MTVLAIFSCLLLLFTGPVCLAKAEELKSAKALTQEWKDHVFTARLAPGYHFNDKAPNQVVVNGHKVVLANKITPREMKFPPVGEGDVLASLYVCDDAVTFCEKHSIQLSGATSSATLAQAIQESGQADKPVAINEHGFLISNLPAALIKAKREKRLLLVDFQAVWCPGCVRLETEIFPDKKFQMATKKFIKVSLDVDQIENFPWSAKFVVPGIPAMIAMNADGEEIARLVDSQPVETYQKFTSEILRDPRPLSKLTESKKRLSSKENLTLGRRLALANRWQESLVYLERVHPVPAELSWARVNAAEKQFDEDKDLKKYASTMRVAIYAEKESTRSLSWRASLVDHLEDKAEITQIAEESAQIANSLLADPKKLLLASKTDEVGEYKGYEKLMVATTLAELMDKADPSKAPEFWKNAARIGQESKIPFKKLGPNLRLLIVLNAAKQFEEAEILAREMLKVAPNDYEVQRRLLRPLMELKKFDEAEAIASKILPRSEGKNIFRVAEAWAKIKNARGDTRGALALIEDHLKRSELENEKMASAKKSLLDLKESVLRPKK